MPHEIKSEGTRPAPTSVDTHIWTRSPDGIPHLVRVKTVGEVFEEIRAVVGNGPAGAEEYFDVFDNYEREWPQGRIAVFAVTGSSEGHYVHVEVILGDRSDCVLLGKTFQGKDAAWAFARRLADLLGV